MPRSNREYLLRYADQSIGNIENALENLKRISDAYGGVALPMDGNLRVGAEIPDDNYDKPHGKHQQYVDIQAQLLMSVLENMKLFKQNYM